MKTTGYAGLTRKDIAKSLRRWRALTGDLVHGGMAIGMIATLRNEGRRIARVSRPN